jgi:hypothetical protein
MRLLTLSIASLLVCAAAPQTDPALERAHKLAEKGMHELHAYAYLDQLVNGVGPRSAGSKGADKAVSWGLAKMKEIGLANVHEIPCMVHTWERGAAEKLTLKSNGKSTPLSCCALGNSIATAPNGLTAEVIEVRSDEELAALGVKAKGKIIFFNRPMNPALSNTFDAYGGAVGQRVNGAAAAARLGAVGVLVRSMTMAHDNVPHTGSMNYEKGVTQIPAAAVSLVAADRLSKTIKDNPQAMVTLKMHCRTLPDRPSASVAGEIPGTEAGRDIVVLGAHLDSWDITPGAHDDGAGVVQCLEAARLIKSLGWKPKRTMRFIFFMNEENGGEGAKAVFESMKGAGETVYAALESDSGGFAPRAFGASLDAEGVEALGPYMPALKLFGIERIDAKGRGGADIGPLAALGAKLFGLVPESQAYFDVHHSRKDTLASVNPRELQMGAHAMTMLSVLLANE